MNTRNPKYWFIGCLAAVVTTLVICVTATIVIDPYFHYHKPLDGVSYRLREERYTNAGIVKNYEYDAVIVGTSMVKNFKTSQMDTLFGVRSVKTPIPGGLYGDIREILNLTFARSEKPKLVFISLDSDRMVKRYDEKNDDMVPYYLYDENWFNDAEYVLNKDILIRDVLAAGIRTIRGIPSMTLDEYSSFDTKTGKDAVLSQYSRPEQVKENIHASQEQISMATENIAYNLEYFVKKYPDTRFVFYVPPYSMIYWDKQYRTGELLAELEIKQAVLGQLMEYPNVEVYCFHEKEEWITDLDHYIDDIHYDAEISEQILQYIANGEYRLIPDELSSHIEKEKDFLMNYPYDDYFKE